MPKAIQDLSNQGFWILILDAWVKMRKIKWEKAMNIHCLPFMCQKFYLPLSFNCVIVAFWAGAVVLMSQTPKWGWRGRGRRARSQGGPRWVHTNHLPSYSARKKGWCLLTLGKYTRFVLVWAIHMHSDLTALWGVPECNGTGRERTVCIENPL